MAQSEKSNCMADMDKVLLDLTNFIPKSTSPLTRREPAVDDKLHGLDMLSVVTPPADITKQNTAAYLAGYLLRKLQLGQCINCKGQLIYDRIPQDNDLYEFLKQKQKP